MRQTFAGNKEKTPQKGTKMNEKMNDIQTDLIKQGIRFAAELVAQYADELNKNIEEKTTLLRVSTEEKIDAAWDIVDMLNWTIDNYEEVTSEDEDDEPDGE